jgi:Domain of unknown function (DUF4430)
MAVSITISVNSQSIRQISDVPWHANMNGQDAMEHAYGSGAGYSFQLQYFGPQLGYEVVSIDNISSQAGTDAYLFWEFSVNGTVAKKGVDETTLNDGDQIGWNFTVYNSLTHGASRYAAIKRQASNKA